MREGKYMSKESIPRKVVRSIIAEILIERANCIADMANKISMEEIKELGFTTDYSGEIGWTACGTRALSDDIREGIMPLEEAIEYLTTFEREDAKRRCQERLKERQENLER